MKRQTFIWPIFGEKSEFLTFSEKSDLTAITATALIVSLNQNEGAYLKKGGMEHRLRNGMWENKCFVNVGIKFFTFSKHMPFRGLSSIPPFTELKGQNHTLMVVQYQVLIVSCTK